MKGWLSNCQKCLLTFLYIDSLAHRRSTPRQASSWRLQHVPIWPNPTFANVTTHLPGTWSQNLRCLYLFLFPKQSPNKQSPDKHPTPWSLFLPPISSNIGLAKKVCLDFSTVTYRKTRTNFLAKPILIQLLGTTLPIDVWEICRMPLSLRFPHLSLWPGLGWRIGLTA